MPVPKRKTSKARRDQRSSSWFLRPQSVAVCSNSACGAPKLPHVICAECGFHKGSKVVSTKTDRALKRGEVRQAQAQKPAEVQEEVVEEIAVEAEDKK